MASSVPSCCKRSNGAVLDECRGRSTAQMRLKKIIQIISSGSQDLSGGHVLDGTNPCVRCFESDSSGSAVRAKEFLSGCGVDLNLRLVPLSESADPEEPEAVGERHSSLSSCDVGGVVETVTETATSIKDKSFETATLSKASCIVKEEEEKTGEDLKEKDASACQRQTEKNDSVSKSNGWEESGDGGEANRDPVTPPEVERPPLGIICGEEDAEEDGTTEPKSTVEDHHGSFLHLLVEAARLLSDNFGENEVEEAEDKEVQLSETSTTNTATGKSVSEEKKEGGGGESAEAELGRPPARRRRRRLWMLEYCGAFEEDTEPVVRSKRGRNQMLPSRYRDSVIEPWKAGSTATRQPRPRR